MSKRSAGFTLIEVMVAISIFAVMSAMAYRGLGAMLSARGQIAQENEKWRQLAMFFARTERDFNALVNRPIRDSYDQIQPALKAGEDAQGETDALLAFTRTGLPGQSGMLSSVQRFGYRLRNRVVEQLIWTAPDQAPRTVPAVYPVLGEVSNFELRYLDRNRVWVTRWPPAGQLETLPLAAEIALTLAGGQRVTRMFVLPSL
jgi:general secretion pathway protein J